MSLFVVCDFMRLVKLFFIIFQNNAQLAANRAPTVLGVGF